MKRTGIGEIRRVLLLGSISFLALASSCRSSADNTTGPNTAALLSSFQTKLGCPRNWDPTCPQTLLTQAQPGVFSETFHVPAGDHHLQIAVSAAIQSDSPHAHPRVGSDRVSLILQNETDVTVTYFTEDGRVDLGYDSSASSDRDKDIASQLTRPRRSPNTFYFVLTDRFSNGDPSNDRGDLQGPREVHGFDPTARGFFHGGDLRGLTSRLDYIKSLGLSAIWLTPVFGQKPVQNASTGPSAGYHGYWPIDFLNVDRHLGTRQDLQELIARAHERGIAVYLDIIVNHTADVIDYREGTRRFVSKESRPYQNSSGENFDDRDFIGSREFPKLSPSNSFPLTPYVPDAHEARIKHPAWLNDLTMYHNRGDSKSSEYGDFDGLDDLFTERPEVIEGMKKIYQTWIDAGIDGFRVDTVKHVNMEFWTDFTRAMRDYAKVRGRTDFFIFGEVYSRSPDLISRYTNEGAFDAALDFPLQSAIAEFAAGRGTEAMNDVFAADDLYTDADSTAYDLPTFISSHDLGRIGMMLMRAGITTRELFPRDRLAHEMLFLLRGQPIVYYGDEQGFTGDAAKSIAQQDMFASAVPEYNDDLIIGGESGSRDRFETTTPMFRVISALTQLRAQHAALRDGIQINHETGDSQVFSLSRIDRRTCHEYLVLSNASGQRRSVEVTAATTSARLAPIYGTRAEVIAGQTGKLRLAAEPLTTSVWAGEKSVCEAPPTKPRLDLELKGELGTTPSGAASGRTQIVLRVDGVKMPRVAFAVRIVGSSHWTPLGVDDNAPHRVYYDVSRYPAGALLEFRAVTYTNSGELIGASSTTRVQKASPVEP